ncbi:thioredoxin domain-containing protein [Sphingorhabdus sp. Alg239-R122]|uniref:DsbA family protein n=1 Tax=Sphingorhabdus sp. Alg239-R122 TaxID=2305989 RepID=UPI0013DA6F91|nr:thioredoxin domain-containing protein [Sphingorhabdus sp. Alg239-R122]
MRKLFSMFGAAFALTLASCSGGGEEGTAGLSGEVIENVAPPEGQEWNQVVTKTEQGGYLMGNPDAPIKLVEFASLTCPACGAFAEQGYPPLRDNYIPSGRVSLEFRNFVRDPIDLSATMLTQCGTDSAFFPLTEAVFAGQQEMLGKMQSEGARLQAAIDLPEEQRYAALADTVGLVDLFAARGISRDQATSCLSDPAKAKQLAESVQKAVEDYNVSGTPTFLLNGQTISYGGWTSLENQLQDLGAR